MLNNYNKNKATWFDLDTGEFNGISDIARFSGDDRVRNIIKVRNRYQLGVKKMKISELPERRNANDQSKLLCIELEDGTAKAKRHNNNNYLSFEI